MSTVYLNQASLASALAALAPYFEHPCMGSLTEETLKAFVTEVTPFFDRLRSSAPIPAAQISTPALLTFVKSVDDPLKRKRQEGGLTNIWRVAGLSRSEVRVSAALANLWQEPFAGERSRTFLAKYLAVALPDIDWPTEPTNGYHIDTECCPVGEREDRVDVIVRTREHLIAIEVKIDAWLGNMQLERYLACLKRSGYYQGRQSHVVLLAPFSTSVEGVAETNWSDVAAAAECAAGRPVQQRNFTARAIAMFGDYVRGF